jgi:hypothetical protein
MELAQAFHVATKKHYILVLTGSLRQHYRTNVILPELVLENKLLSAKWETRKVYSCKRRFKKQDEIPLVKIPHELTCTEILVRSYLSKYGQLLSDAHFSGQPYKPDGGILYPDGSQLLFEYCSKDNFSRKKLMAQKIEAYHDHQTYQIIIFVIQSCREKVLRFVMEHPSNVWFCDLETFLTPAYHEQLQAPIYIWGGSGETLPIIK